MHMVAGNNKVTFCSHFMIVVCSECFSWNEHFDINKLNGLHSYPFVFCWDVAWKKFWLFLMKQTEAVIESWLVHTLLLQRLQALPWLPSFFVQGHFLLLMCESGKFLSLSSVLCTIPCFWFECKAVHASKDGTEAKDLYSDRIMGMECKSIRMSLILHLTQISSCFFSCVWL